MAAIELDRPEYIGLDDAGNMNVALAPGVTLSGSSPDDWAALAEAARLACLRLTHDRAQRATHRGD